MPVKHYRESIVWQKAMDLVESLYKFTSQFPREEIYGLTGQLRRASDYRPLQLPPTPIEVIALSLFLVTNH